MNFFMYLRISLLLYYHENATLIYLQSWYKTLKPPLLHRKWTLSQTHYIVLIAGNTSKTNFLQTTPDFYISRISSRCRGKIWVGGNFKYLFGNFTSKWERSYLWHCMASVGAHQLWLRNPPFLCPSTPPQRME